MLNSCTIQGRLAADPQLRQTTSGKSVCSFRVACTRNFGKDPETDWLDCVAWGQTGEFVSKYFQKGSMAVVSGRLQIRDWTDREGGKRKSAEVAVDNIYFGESAKAKPAGAPVDAAPPSFEELAETEGGELPV